MRGPCYLDRYIFFLTISFFSIRESKEYEISANEENDADKDEDVNEEVRVRFSDDEEKHQLRLQNDWIARSLTSIGKAMF